MLNRSRTQMAPRGLGTITALLTLAVSMVLSHPAFALIRGGEGNDPFSDPGWPAGAAAMFNNPARVAWWEGPPFGGGQYHAECRGNTKTFNAVLAEFAEIDVKTKRLIVHDGVGHSFWLNPNREPQKEADAIIDWVFMVWVPENWKRLQRLPADLDSTDPKNADTGPPATIDLYTGGSVRFSEFTVPKGIEVIDNRLKSHGFTPADGSVIEGKVVDSVTQEPIAAHVQLQRVTPVAGETCCGECRYSNLKELVADEQGHWILKNVPAGRSRVVVKAEGYAPRVFGYFDLGKQPRWQEFNGELSRATTVSGRVTDSAGLTLDDVTVELSNVASGSGRSYPSPQEYSAQTDADGGFHIDNVPAGTASIRIRKPGYCRPGLGPSIRTPATDVSLQMVKSARLVVTIDFAETERPEEYIVEIEQEGGPAIGTWGGSAQIDAKNQKVFEDVPPGRYVLYGHPNPTTESQKTDPVTIELVGGKPHNVSLHAK